MWVSASTAHRELGVMTAPCVSADWLEGVSGYIHRNVEEFRAERKRWREGGRQRDGEMERDVKRERVRGERAGYRGEGRETGRQKDRERERWREL